MTSVLGIDAGTVRVGLAVSDPTGTIASPLTAVARRDDAQLWRTISQVVSEREVDRLVVGLPRKLDGSEGEAAAMARALGDEAGRRTGLPLEYWDERFTSQAAERALIAGGMRRARRRETVDSVAAALMLQSWLDARRARAAR